MATLHPSYITFLSNFVTHKVLTIKQLSALSGRSLQVIRRTIRNLVEKNVLAKDDTFYSNRPGRREEIVYLTQHGIEVLKARGIIPHDDSYGEILKDGFPVEHDLLVTWFQIHLRPIEKSWPNLSVYTICNPFDIKTNTGNSEETFIPDAIFCVVNNRDHKALLFFLEVDMGTESFGSSNDRASTIDKKIFNYQQYFYSGQYKQLANTFGFPFTGFRLLIVANEYQRHIALCKRIQTTPPNNFIWLTDQESMFSKGLGDTIWAAAGEHDKSGHSILGSFSCKTALTCKV